MKDAVVLEDRGDFKVIATQDSAGNYTNVTEIYSIEKCSDYTVGTENGVDTEEYHFVNSPSTGSISGEDSNQSSYSSHFGSDSSSSIGTGSGINISFKTILKICAFFISVTIISNISTFFHVYFGMGKTGAPGIVLFIVSSAWIIWSIYKAKKQYYHKKRFLLQLPFAAILFAFSIYLLLCSFNILDINTFLNVVDKMAI